MSMQSNTVSVETPESNPEVNTKRVRIDRNTFIRAWEAGDTTDEVAATLGMDKSKTMSRAYQLRALGLPLKSLKSVRKQRSTIDHSFQLLADIRGVSVDDIHAEHQAKQEAKAQKQAG